MKKVVWQSRTPVVQESFLQGKLLPGANGGNTYDFHALQVLNNDFEVNVSGDAILKSKESMWRYWHRLRNLKPDADVLVQEPYPLVFGNSKLKMPRIGMIHHIDDDLARSTVKHQWYFRRLKRRLSQTGLVVTVSKYWEDYLNNLGCSNVRIIYNSFDAADYIRMSGNVEAFLEKFNIPADKPLIYAGNATRQKGIYEVYEALKEKGYHLLMSGSQNKAKDLPVQYLHLNTSEYRAMLHACDLVITFSHMTEGWNRIAHEALLSSTPVIGSGVGGMKELLEGAGQVIVRDPSGLANAVEHVLKEKAILGKRGLEFVIRFDMEYFRQAWKSVIEEAMNMKLN